MFWGGSFLFQNNFERWDDKPGGTVVNSYTLDGEEFVEVEFKHTPGKRYIYLAP